MTPRARDPAVRPSCPGMAQMALATESDSRSLEVGPGRNKNMKFLINFNEKFNGRNSLEDLCQVGPGRIARSRTRSDSTRPTLAIESDVEIRP